LHPKKQIKQLRESLQQFGWTIPMLVREDGTVIAGHGRLEAGRVIKPSR
jgi:ParB-like chromosome segregation protein Spo0J